MPSTPVSTGGTTAIRQHNGKSKAKGYALIAVIGVILLSLVFVWSRPKSQANQQASKVNWDRRPCDDELDQKIADHTNDKDTPRIKFTLQEGCYAGDYKLPNANWSGSEEVKSRNLGDWASVWCQGRPNPSRIYYWYEDFHDEFLSCRVFALQGKGWIAFKRNY